MNTAFKAALATLCFAAVHSLLAARRTKTIAANLFGDERYRATYRLLYVGQSLVTFMALLCYTGMLPRHTLYRAPQRTRLLMRAGQLASLIMIYRGARQNGIARLTGVTNFSAWRRGLPIPPGPAAQGPELGRDGTLLIGGPFLWSRHPLNLAPLGLFWLTPDMTTRRLAFNLVSTAYLFIGSKHEEHRMLSVYPQLYAAYQHSGVPFYLPTTLKARPQLHDRNRTSPRIDQRY